MIVYHVVYITWKPAMKLYMLYTICYTCTNYLSQSIYHVLSHMVWARFEPVIRDVQLLLLMSWYYSHDMKLFKSNTQIPRNQLLDSRVILSHGPLARYVKLRFAHARGMPGTFPPAADFEGNRGLAIPTCITARAWRTCRDACRDR